MQLLASGSFEDKFTKGLGIIPNQVDKFTFKDPVFSEFYLIAWKDWIEEEA